MEEKKRTFKKQMRPRDVAEMGEGKWWGVGRKTNKARPSGQKAEASWGGREEECVYSLFRKA